MTLVLRMNFILPTVNTLPSNNPKRASNAKRNLTNDNDDCDIKVSQVLLGIFWRVLWISFLTSRYAVDWTGNRFIPFVFYAKAHLK